MNSLFAMRALLFATELLAGSSLLMALAWLAANQKSASARHLSWAGAFGAVLALPVLAAIVRSPFHIFLSAPAPEAPLPHLLLSNAVYVADPPAPPVSTMPTLDPDTILLALGAIWVLGVCVAAIRLAIGLACLSALKRRSKIYALSAEDLPRIAATRRECELRLSDSEHGPITWGVFRPIVLLPKSAISWPRERLHAVLFHELAHIRRRDALVQLVSQIVCTLYWPNPFVWFGAKRLRREAEIAADDAVIVSGIRPSAYAGELLEIANVFRAQPPVFSAAPLSMAAPSALEARIKSVLASTTFRSGVTRMDVLKISGLGVVAATLLAFACPSLAQESSTAPIASEQLPAPDAPPAPPAPPQADVVAPPPPAEAAPAVPPTPPTPPSRADAETHSLHGLSPEEREHIRAEVAKARRAAREAIEKARPEIEKAMAEAKISREAAMQAVREARPQIDAAREEIERSRPEIEKAITESGPQIDEALAKAQPEIDKALAKVRTELAKAHLDTNIEVRVDEALKRAEIRIQAAEARAAAHAQRHEERIIEERRTDNDDNSDAN